MEKQTSVQLNREDCVELSCVRAELFIKSHTLKVKDFMATLGPKSWFQLLHFCFWQKRSQSLFDDTMSALVKFPDDAFNKKHIFRLELV